MWLCLRSPHKFFMFIFLSPGKQQTLPCPNFLSTGTLVLGGSWGVNVRTPVTPVSTVGSWDPFGGECFVSKCLSNSVEGGPVSLRFIYKVQCWNTHLCGLLLLLVSEPLQKISKKTKTTQKLEEDISNRCNLLCSKKKWSVDKHRLEAFGRTPTNDILCYFCYQNPKSRCRLRMLWLQQFVLLIKLL